MPKHLTISYDGSLVISGYGTLRLGETNLSSVISHAFALKETDHKEIPANVFISIKLKDDEPTVRWEDESC